MIRKQMWMGTRGFEQWVPAPAINMDRGRGGYAVEQVLLTGGIDVYRAKATYGAWNLAWPNQAVESLAPIEAMAAGLYDTPTNKGLVRFIDPMAAYSNVLPPDWAAPGMADSMPLLAGQAPTISYEAVSTYGHPARTANYAATASTSRKLYIPIPPGHSFLIGVRGSAASTGRVRVAPVTGATVGTPVALTWLSRNTQVLTNYRVSGATVTGVEVSISGAGTIALNSMLARIAVGTNAPHQTGRYLPGRGASGCAFASTPAEVAISAALNHTGFQARLVEVEPWL